LEIKTITMYTDNPINDAQNYLHSIDSREDFLMVYECVCCGESFTEGVLIEGTDPVDKKCIDSKKYMTYYKDQGVPERDIMDMERNMKPVNQ